ncbi:unnamed protein product [Arctia plantaginis]|uniref:Trichohyalin-plectin-homology domain-containing protein n=1 Tax=Arctia plantaginis TaxID=874455 RepID=A0A8S0Z2S8_ARCPL|nr:unnamed protein product [Arctia plantaginis]
MREKQMRKLAQKEMDKMWYEVVMKESEALAARAEYETVERYRRDQEAKQLSLDIIEQRRLKRAKEQEMLKQETLRLKAKFEDDNRKAAEEERQRQEYKREVVREINNVMEDRKKVLAQRKEDARVISSTWDSLAGQGLANENAKEQRRRRKLRELGECNRHMIELKNNLEEFKNISDPLIFEEGQRRQDEVDLKRCRYRVYTRKLSKDIGAHIQNQIKEKEDALKNRCDETEDYNKQVSEQLEKLVKHKELTDSQARKLDQKDIQRQIEYNRVLQERARQDAILEQKKCQIARDQYQEEIKKMLSRPFFSDHVHPFMKQMASGLKMCRCRACPNYCLYPSNN